MDFDLPDGESYALLPRALAQGAITQAEIDEITHPSGIPVLTLGGPPVPKGSEPAARAKPARPGIERHAVDMDGVAIHARRIGGVGLEGDGPCDGLEQGHTVAGHDHERKIIYFVRAELNGVKAATCRDC